MKRVLAVLLAVCVVCTAGAAFAQPRMPRHHEGPHEGRHARFSPNMPQEIRAKVVELEKLKIDLDEALTSRPINKAKALEVHAKMLKVRKDISAWRFERKLERLEKMTKSEQLHESESEKGESESDTPDAQ